MRILMLVAALAFPALAQEHAHGGASDKDSNVPAHQKHALDPNATADVLEDVDRRLVISLGLRRVAISACSARHTWLVRLQSLRPQA